MLSNSLTAAIVAAAYVLALVLELNPALPLAPRGLVPLVATVGVYYVVPLTLICYVLLVMRQLLARELFSPAWISVGVLAWLLALASETAAVLTVRNLLTLRLVLDPATITALERSAIVLQAAALLMVGAAAARARAPDARLVWAPIFVIVTTVSVAAPVAMRGQGTLPVLEARPIDAPIVGGDTEPAARVAVIAIDGASLDFVSRAAADGRLPNFGRILDAGAVRRLATIHPTSPEGVWAAAATGKLPQKNGVRSATIYQMAGGGGSIQLLPDYCFAHGLVRFGFLVEESHTSATFRARTLWAILSTYGIAVGVVGWPLTQPAPTVRGYVVSDTFLRTATRLSPLDDPTALYPPDLQPEAMAALERATLEAASAAVMASLGVDARYETPARVDRVYDRVARALAQARPPQVALTRYQSLDPIGHYFLRYAEPSEFGDVTDEERHRLGSVLDRHYALIDEAVGRAIAGLGPDDLLLVVSGYGMEPLGFGKRLIERVIGDPDVSGTHERAPDGFLMAYGGPVARGRRSTRASVVDVAPTILYFLGLPIGRDMDGFARTDLFQASFTDSRPLSFIPTYDR